MTEEIAVKRRVVNQMYAPQIATMYSESKD